MVKLNFNVPILGLDGQVAKEDGKEIPLGKILGNQLVAGTKGDALKYYDWATKMYKGEEITVDKSDANKIKEFIQNSETITILAKAPLIDLINKAISEFEKSVK